MAVLNFPSNPNLNQVYQANESSWRWDGDRWKRLPDPGAQGVQGPIGAGGTWAVSIAGIHTTKNVGIGSELPGQKLVVSGITSTNSLNVVGIATIGGPLDLNGELDVTGISTLNGGLRVGTAGTFCFEGNIVAGIVTALTYYGDGSKLTGIAVTDFIHAQTLKVNGISTFSSAEFDNTLIDIHGNVGTAKSVLTSTGAGVSWGKAAAKVTIAESAPTSAEEGDLWWDSDDGDLGVYYNDGDSTQWVTVSEGPIGPTGAQGVPGGAIGINTVGFSTFKDLLVSGVSTFNGAANFNGNTVITNLNAGGNSYPTISGTNGQVLTTDGSGSLTWTNKGSGSATGAGGTWATDTIGINTTKNVGIGTTAKTGYALYVEGNQRVTGILTVGTASLTLDGITNKVTVGTAVTLFGETGLFVGGDSNLHSTGLEVKNVNASGDLDVDGHTNLDNVSISGIATVVDLDVDGHTNLDNVSIVGVTTATGNVHIATGDLTFLNNAHKISNGSSSGNLTIQGGATYAGGRILLTGGSGSGTGDIRFYADTTQTPVERLRINPTGIVSIFQDLDVDGHTNLDNVTIAGVVTATSFIGNGSGLTGVVASGTGIVIKNSDSTVGTAGTINFGSGLNVSPAFAGIVTITAINSDWDATSGISSILNKPILITYDLTGSNNTTNQAIISLTPNSGTADTIELLGANGTSLTWDASNKRVTFDSVAPVKSDWNATTGQAQILNKPTIPSAYTLPTASGSTLGGIKVGANLSINGSGVLSANVGGYTLPMATANTLGGIKIGSGLSIDGNGIVTASGSASTPSIADVNGTTGSIGDDASAELNITGHKAYTLFKVTVSKPSWVRIYCDDASRDADVNRSESNDPTPGSGVIAEVRTTSDNQAVLITPGVQGFNNDSVRNSNIYTSVTNRSGSATAVTVTLTVLQTGS